MKFLVYPLALAIAGLVTLEPLVSLALPLPDRQGDYPRPKSPRQGGGPGQVNWQVVDTDPKGLNCRMAQRFQNFVFDGADAPAALFQDKIHPVNQWQVVMTWKQGQRLQAVTGNMGRQQIMLMDTQGKWWLPVGYRRDGRSYNCLVRANSRFIRPLKEDAMGKPLE